MSFIRGAKGCFVLDRISECEVLILEKRLFFAYREVIERARRIGVYRTTLRPSPAER
jgi:hypothetical protein